MRNMKYCKIGQHEVEESKFYNQGNMCKQCRNEKNKGRKEAKKGLELAEYLLNQSCIRALERVKGNGNKSYIGVKCQWEKPSSMKAALMKKKEFWESWIRQTEIYESSGKPDSARPTLDRIEADPSKNGHYYIENLQVLSAAENARKAKEVECVVVLIKDLKVIEVSSFDSVNQMMKKLKLVGYNVVSVKRDTGAIINIGNGYSLLVQTVGGQLKEIQNPLYKMVIQKKLIAFDKVTGIEVVIRETQSVFETSGIWFNSKVKYL